MSAVRSTRVWAVALVILTTLVARLCLAWSDVPLFQENFNTPDGVHILDGSYVMNHGRLHVNVTNHGLIGSLYEANFPFSNAPSCQWPGGSGHEYIWASGLWIGGIVNGERTVTTGQYERELRPDSHLYDTIYEAVQGRATRPSLAAEAQGRRLPDRNADDDRDGTYDEDMLNNRDDDGDGEVDEDFGQIGDQMFTCTMYDDLPLVRELYPDHIPLGVKVVQRTASWADLDNQDFVALDFEITNTTIETLEGIYLGYFVDFEIQRLQTGSQPDDIAGFFDGAVRGQDGSFYRIKMAYAQDADPTDPLTGCIGLMTIGHDTDFLNESAPHITTVNSFQIFSAGGQVNQGGEPLNDADRYYLMSRNAHDEDLQPHKKGDIKVLVSSGPFNDFQPQETLHYQLALVAGEGFGGMMLNAVRAAELGRGQMVDWDQSGWTGYGGRETKVCIEDYGTNWQGTSILYRYRYAFTDEYCTGSYPVFPYFVIAPDGLYEDEDGKLCTWVNADNCDECFRTLGVECNQQNNLFWTDYQDAYRKYSTGRGGREHQLAWAEGRAVPPISPQARVVPGDRQVEVFWNDISEFDPDPISGDLDFESYQVWESTHWTRPEGVNENQTPPERKWALIEEIDLINTVPGGVGISPNDIPLGLNTGLEHKIYVPACLTDPEFDGLAEIMQDFVNDDVQGRHITMPPLRSPNGSVIPGREEFIVWETRPDILDTFFAVTPRETAPGTDGVDKRSTRFYHHLRTGLHNGFPMHMSVTASDHELTDTEEHGLVVSGRGVAGEPANTPLATMPRPDGQTPQERSRRGNLIYVYPNPATRESLAEFLAQPPSHEDPTGVRIAFNNLPEAHNTIRIYSTAGDIIETIEHDGYRQGGMATWNLISRNGQEVVSGIYLFTVHSDRAGFDVHQGRFVVIR